MGTCGAAGGGVSGAPTPSCPPARGGSCCDAAPTTAVGSFSIKAWWCRCWRLHLGWGGWGLAFSPLVLWGQAACCSPGSLGDPHPAGAELWVLPSPVGWERGLLGKNPRAGARIPPPAGAPRPGLSLDPRPPGRVRLCPSPGRGWLRLGAGNPGAPEGPRRWQLRSSTVQGAEPSDSGPVASASFRVPVPAAAGQDATGPDTGRPPAARPGEPRGRGPGSGGMLQPGAGGTGPGSPRAAGRLALSGAGRGFTPRSSHTAPPVGAAGSGGGWGPPGTPALPCRGVGHTHPAAPRRARCRRGQGGGVRAARGDPRPPPPRAPRAGVHDAEGTGAAITGARARPLVPGLGRRPGVIPGSVLAYNSARAGGAGGKACLSFPLL